MSSIKNFKLYIDGGWIESASGETFLSDNPAKPKQILGIFQKGNQEDINKAVDAAEKAFEEWSQTPTPKRGLILLRTAQLLHENKEALAREMTMEMGKVLAESRGDVQEAIDITEYMAGEGRRLFGNTTPSELRKKFAMTIRMPIGVCGLITPWNFPMAIPAWKMMTALICGNAVVFKPSSDTPLCATRLVEALERAGLPKGVLNMVTGPGEAAGMTLVRHEKVRAVSFTGHKDTGAYILKEAGLKRVGLEMGGKNGIIIMDDANLNLALDGVIWGGFGTTGQRCTAASRVIVHEKVKEKFETMLVNRIKKLKLGDGLEPDTDIGPLISKAAQEKSAKYVEIGKNEGAKLLSGGNIPKMDGFFFEPTLFTDCSIDMRIAQEEIFGPVVALISVKDFDEAIDVINSVEYGLSSAIYTKDVSRAFEAITRIEAGLTYVNSSTIGSEVHLPFGGIKHTGIGAREGGIEGINEFSEIKTVYIDYSGKLQKAQIDLS
ncbi:MAG TPA: aldehyde dehydrogenase family protein [Candidatus Krumholzibacteriaceae bacterium]|jgi:aldehyde dehydrogenase (NAD+)|nr:aldehyde dehydrogenase family protein [Candidatus Krumholzibacteriaceae bacterium]